MFGDKRGEYQFAVAYAQKFWDAGNLVVTLMFALAFAVYVAIVQYQEVRYLVSKYFKFLFLAALFGNGDLGFVLWRLYVHEYEIA